MNVPSIQTPVTALRRASSLYLVIACRHAGAECAPVSIHARVPLLLRLLLRLLLLLLLLGFPLSAFLLLAIASHAATERPDACSDCGAFAGITADGTTHGTNCCTTRGAAQGTGGGGGRRGRLDHLRLLLLHRGVETALLHRPLVALELIEALLLLVLPPCRIGEHPAPDLGSRILRWMQSECHCQHA